MVEVMFLIPTSSQTLGMEGPLVLYCQFVPKLDHLEVHTIIVCVYACVGVWVWVWVWGGSLGIRPNQGGDRFQYPAPKNRLGYSLSPACHHGI